MSACQLVTDTDVSYQVIGPATSAQLLNAGVVNSLYKFHQAVSKVSTLHTVYISYIVHSGCVCSTCVIDSSNGRVSGQMLNAVIL